MQSRYSARFVGTQASGSLPGPANEGHSGYTIDQLTPGIDAAAFLNRGGDGHGGWANLGKVAGGVPIG